MKAHALPPILLGHSTKARAVEVWNRWFRAWSKDASFGTLLAQLLVDCLWVLEGRGEISSGEGAVGPSVIPSGEGAVGPSVTQVYPKLHTF